ncbi:DgyrCDS559 [Dimorphilus gyrociliatus]|uniref:DgyrCDS559 n=1 Tax=Dimorphilus gyrociliatus TaxID=2664684 RepID=A0A7I8V515_9ANNE|nr:DgyrCDS559 [Dimorphilus gyrociliatus]
MAMLPVQNFAGDNESDEGIDTREPPSKVLITLSIVPNDPMIRLEDLNLQIRRLEIDGVQWKEFVNEQTYQGTIPRLIVKCLIDDSITNEQLIDEIRALEDYVEEAYVMKRAYQPAS